MNLVKQNDVKYKISLLFIVIVVINIILMLIFTYLISGQVKSEEISKFYLKDITLTSSDKLYVPIETENNEANEDSENDESIKNNEDNKNNENEQIDETNINNVIIEENYPTGEEKYYIKVNCEAQTVTIYEKDENGYYSNPTKVMLCSTGTNTPQTGIYKITFYKKEWLALQGSVYGQYCTQIVGDILFHSVPYLENKNPGSLEYWEYDKLGEEASLGCVRLTVQDAKWIFDNCQAGTKVEFYSSENPGPLGKPEVKKISQYEELRNWDPTDEKEENPWKIYFEEERIKINKLQEVIKKIQEITRYMKII